MVRAGKQKEEFQLVYDNINIHFLKFPQTLTLLGSYLHQESRGQGKG